MFSSTRLQTDNVQDHIEDLKFDAFHSLFGYFCYDQTRPITVLHRLRPVNMPSFGATTVMVLVYLSYQILHLRRNELPLLAIES
jgi:hypothetical protein